LPDLDWERDAHNVPKAPGLFVVETGLFLMAFGGCQGLQPGVTGSTGIQSINHIVLMVQENRPLDNYLGHLPAYFAENGYPQATQQLQ